MCSCRAIGRAGSPGFGFSPEACADIRPGIVAVSLSAYGHEGPWAARHGFDSLVQTASGINHAEGEAAGVTGPKELPAQALDHATGYLMAFGAMMALARKAREGGSWHVRVSLAQTGHWFKGLGRMAAGFDCKDPKAEDVADLLDTMETPFGQLTFVRHAAQAVRDACPLGPSAGEARHPRARLAGVSSPHGARGSPPLDGEGLGVGWKMQSPTEPVTPTPAPPRKGEGSLRALPRAIYDYRVLLFGFFVAAARWPAASAARAHSSISSGSSNRRSGTRQ